MTTYGSRRALAQRAMEESIRIRTGVGLDLRGPLDVYALCQRLGVSVRFVPISMEGLYKRGDPPRILLSALRPPGRRVFTCAHELGHHVCGHGFTVDQILEESRGGGPLSPQEFLVQTFAGFLLMPTLGVRRAFTERGWSATGATPAQLYTVACSFGVGYTTLVHHLAYGLEMLPDRAAHDLLRVPVPRIRRELLGQASSAPLIVADQHWALPTVDAEAGTRLLLPCGTELVDGSQVEHRGDLPSGRLFEAVRLGIARVACPGTPWTVFVRVSRRQYVGLAQYRHLEDDEPDDGDAGGQESENEEGATDDE